MRILVTGAAGYIGYLVYSKLKETNNEIIGVDIDPYEGQYNLDLVTDSLHEFKNVDVVVHLAYIPGFAQVKNNLAQAYKINILATNKVIDYCAKNSCKLVFISTIGVIGEPCNLPITESHSLNPWNPYTKQKAQNELHILNQPEIQNYVILRLSNVYGRYKAHNQEIVKHTVINKFIDLAITQEPIDVYGGNQERDFVHVQDIAEMILRFTTSEIEPGIYNVASGENLSIWQVAELIRHSIKTGVKINYNFYKQTDVLTSCFKVSCEKTKRAINYKPQYTVEGEISEQLNG